MIRERHGAKKPEEVPEYESVCPHRVGGADGRLARWPAAHPEVTCRSLLPNPMFRPITWDREIGSKSRCSAPMSWRVNTRFRTTGPSKC